MTHQLVSAQVATDRAQYYIPVRHAPPHTNVPWLAARAFLNELWAWGRESTNLWFWNLGFELQVSRNEGIAVGAFSDPYRDAMVAAWLCGWGTQQSQQKLRLKETACVRLPELYGQKLPSFREAFGDRDIRELSPVEVAPYGCKDVLLTRRMAEEASKVLHKRQLWAHFVELDMPLVEPLRAQAEWGAEVDIPLLETLRAERLAYCAGLEADFVAATRRTVAMPVKKRKPTGEFYKNGNPKMAVVVEQEPIEASADISNDHTISRWLYDEMKLWPTTGLKRGGNGNWPLKGWMLERYAAGTGEGARLAQMILNYRRASKLCSTYLDVMIEQPTMWHDGRLHPSTHLCGTETQRFSSSGPNWQNLPSHSEEAKTVAKAIRARSGNSFVLYDESQVELRLAAHISRDPALVDAYLWGDDVHARTLAEVQKTFPDAQRKDAKITNFSTLYQISARSLAVKIRGDARTAQRFIDAFYLAHPGIRDYHRRMIAFVTKHGYAPTLDGFRRYFPDWRPGAEPSWSTCNAAINTAIQGSAAGIIKRAQRDLHRRWVAAGLFGDGVWFAGQVHDSLIVECADEHVARVRRDMEECMTSTVLRVPLAVEGGVGRTWEEAK